MSSTVTVAPAASSKAEAGPDSPSTTSNLHHQRSMLRQLYRQCDVLRTGRVNTTVLIDTIDKMLVSDMAAVSKWSLQDLFRMLSPTLDDRKVDEDEFVDVGARWIDRLDAEQEEERKNDVGCEFKIPAAPVPKLSATSAAAATAATAALPRRQLRWKDKHSRSRSACGALEAAGDTASSSLGLLDPQDLAMESTFGSLEGLGSGDSAVRVNHSVDLAEMASELDRLRKANKKLADDNSALKEQVAAAEDQLTGSQREAEGMGQRNRELQAALDRMQKDEEEAGEEAGRTAHTKAWLLTRENERLESEVRETKESLLEAKREKRAAAEAADASSRQAEALRAAESRGKSQVTALRSRVEELRRQLGEAREESASLRAEVEKAGEDLSAKEEEIREILLAASRGAGIMDESALSHDALDVSMSAAVPLPASNNVSADDHVWNNLNNSFFGAGGQRVVDFGPKAVSTPFVKNNNLRVTAGSLPSAPERRSIGDEIKQAAAVDEDCEDNLRESPLCEKSNNHVDGKDIPATPVKAVEAVVTATRASQTEEDNSWSWDRRWALATAAGCLVVGLLLFTFAGAMEVGAKTYYPVTWSPDLGLPEPWVGLRTFAARTPGVW